MRHVRPPIETFTRGWALGEQRHMQKLMEKGVAALGARDWRLTAAAAALIAIGLVLLMRHHGFGTTARAPGLVEASVVAHTAVRPAAMSSLEGNAASAVVQRAPAGVQHQAASDTARALQAGLRRAGCYEGPVDGQWSRQSREAMARFVTGVNAQLPVERPEGVLLALLEANTNHMCGSQRGTTTAAVAPTPASPLAPVTSATPVVASRVAPAALPAPPPVHAAEAAEGARDVPRFTPFALAAAAVPPLAAPVPAAPAAHSPPPSAPAASGDTAAPRSGRTSRPASRVYMAPRKYIVRHRSRSPADQFARSVTRNVRSLQRSLGMIVHY